MTRMRVHELAKELNMNNKDLIDRILKLGIQVKNHMSTLTDSAVTKIRQQFSESRAEQVEEKRIGRAVIRRRKKPAEEESRPAEEAAPEGLVEAAASAEIAQIPESPSMPARELPGMPIETEPEAAPQPPVTAREPEAEERTVAEIEPAELVEEAAAQPEALAKTAEAAASSEPGRYEAKAAAVEPSVLEGPAQAAAVPEAAAQPEELKLREEPSLERAPESELMPPPSPSPLETEPSSEPAAGHPAAAEEEEEEEEGARAKPRKAKKRRRKKARKDEPARIIKLPEIMPEEPEEEAELPQHLAAKLQVKTEETETKEPPRKKRIKTAEEFEREAAEKKARAPRRKEVFEREDLYSKKEIAAQEDRGRQMRGEKGRPLLKEVPRPDLAVPKPGKRKVKVDEAITISNLAKQMGIKAGELIKKLLLLGMPANINQAIDFETASLLASEFEYDVERVGFEEEGILQVREDLVEELQPRPPVVTVMGHVDHGKTSLLDAIRDTNVIEGEAGGITQHIGAYYVKLPNGNVVFLDTPGHEAFTSMRARGAKVTDLVILVVAADDGVMEQTVEAINHAKAAEVPIIVAINKIDKPNANVDRVKRELADHGLIPEEWGGNVTMVEISAKKRTGIDELLEMVLLQAELLELKANPNKPARGRVIEAKLDKGRGPVATILIQEGTLKTGEVYLCGVNSGRVRNMFNDRGQKLEAAGPSMPIEVLGLSGVPNAGDDFIALTDERQAKMIAEHRMAKLRQKELSRTGKVTLESLFEQIQEGEVKELKIILKTDVHGSLEAIRESLLKLSTPEVKVNVIHYGTGAATETDVMLASASNAIVIGFNVRSESKVHELAEQEKVDLRSYDIIYQLLNDVKDAMVGMLEPVYQEHVIGRAEVRQTFQVPRIGMIAGSYVLDGRVERGARARVLRDQVVVYDGKVGSLRRFKDDAKEVKAGFECGIGIENFNDIKVNDILEVYELQEVKPVLESESDRRVGH